MSSKSAVSPWFSRLAVFQGFPIGAVETLIFRVHLNRENTIKLYDSLSIKKTNFTLTKIAHLPASLWGRTTLFIVWPPVHLNQAYQMPTTFLLHYPELVPQVPVTHCTWLNSRTWIYPTSENIWPDPLPEKRSSFETSSLGTLLHLVSKLSLDGCISGSRVLSSSLSMLFELPSFSNFVSLSVE